jgi:hypothetical protein
MRGSAPGGTRSSAPTSRRNPGSPASTPTCRATKANRLVGELAAAAREPAPSGARQAHRDPTNAPWPDIMAGPAPDTRISPTQRPTGRDQNDHPRGGWQHVPNRSALQLGSCRPVLRALSPPNSASSGTRSTRWHCRLEDPAASVGVGDRGNDQDDEQSQDIHPATIRPSPPLDFSVDVWQRAVPVELGFIGG